MPNTETEFPIAGVGYDFKTASAIFREKLLLDFKNRQALTADLRQLDPTAGCVVLETCNRVEWLVSSCQPKAAADIMAGRMLGTLAAYFPQLPVLPAPRRFCGREAVVHWLRLAAGLESLALGEAQIAGQIHSALRRSREEQRSSALLNGLGNAVGRLAKAASRIGFRSGSSRGVHYLLERFLLAYFENRPDPGLFLVAGMGAIGRKIASLLSARWPERTVSFNRTVPPSQHGNWRAWDELAGFTRKAAALIIATASREPVFFLDMLDLDHRSRPLLVMDLGMPRQTEPDLARDPRILYRSLDHLLQIEQPPTASNIRIELDREIHKAENAYARFCCERSLGLLFQAVDRQRQNWLAQIPWLLPSACGRGKLESALAKIIKSYTHQIFVSLHAAGTAPSVLSGNLRLPCSHAMFREGLNHDLAIDQTPDTLQPAGHPAGGGSE